MNIKLCTTSLLIAAACCLAPVAFAQTGPIIATPGDLKWSPVGSLPPGASVAVIEGKMNEAGPITARLRLPADYRIPAHQHPGVERVTVISGTFHYGMGDKLDMQKTRALGPGSVVVMQPNTKHFAWTKEETVLQLNTVGPWGIDYIDHADDPRTK